MINGNDATHALLCACLTGCSLGGCGRSQLAPRVEHLDALTGFEKMVLPLAFDCLSAAGRSVTNLGLLRGIHRKKIVRNRVLGVECEKLWRGAGVDAFAVPALGAVCANTRRNATPIPK